MKLFVFLCLVIHQVLGQKPCALRPIPGADSVCVCNQTYCDDFPPLKRPDKGYALVFESGKSGHRFKQSTLKVEANGRTPSTETLVISIDKSKTYQNIMGFGGAFTDFAGSMLNSVPKEVSDAILKSYFSDDGIQYSMARVPIGSTDFSFRFYSYDDVNDDKSLSHFALADEDFKLKIPHIKHAQTLSKDLRLFGSPWFGPKWITTDSKAKEPNQLRGDVGGEYYEIWAKYFVRFLDAYKAQNISYWGITVQNEPTWGRTFGWFYFNTTMEREFIKKNLGPHLHSAGYTLDKLEVMIYDDNVHYGDGRPAIEEYAKTVLSDSEAKKYVSGIAYHWYENSRTNEYPIDILENIHNNYPQYFTMMTEACHLEGTGNGKWEFAEHYAHDIIRDINHWAKAWVEWNMVLGLNGCDRCNAGQFGSAIIVDVEKKEALKQPTFYAIGHFSKFLSRDSVRIGHTLTNSKDNVFVLTVKRPDNGVVVVVLNQSDRKVEVEIRESNNHLSNAIPEHSIQTYLFY